MSWFCLRAHPCRCIRQDMSDETMQSGDAFCMKASLSYPIFEETASSVAAKVPPKPQHSSTRSNSANSTPETPLSSVRGFEKIGSCTRSDIEDIFRPRTAEQLVCSATLCSNVAHGKSRISRT